MSDINLRSILSRFLGYRNSRHLWTAFGYPNTLSFDDYWRAYRRGGVANRIVKSYPKACWRDGPVVRDEAGGSYDPEDNDYSSFAQAAYKLYKDFNVLHYMERADRLARLGQYGILLLGFADGANLSEPQVGKSPIVYLNAYPERSITITKWDTDVKSPRFGKPVLYKVDDGKDSGDSAAQTTPRTSFTVHYSRVIHIVENPDDNETFGEPALRPCWNYLMDLEKVSGSSAETFWLNARGGMAIEAAADAKLTTESIEAMKAQAKEYEDQLRRVMAFQGASVKLLTTNVASPQYNMEMLQALIAGTTAIPQRILFGSERGELASSQDENSWESRIDERRTQHCGPSILEPFTWRMIETGNLPEPQGDWWADWPEASASSPEKEADIAVKRAQALAAYSNSASDQIVPPEEFRLWLGLEAVPDDSIIDEPDDADDLGNDLDSLEPGGDNAQATALNSGQILALKEIAMAVGNEELPVDVAVQLILVGFPSLDEETAKRIVDPMDAFEPKDLTPPALQILPDVPNGELGMEEEDDENDS